MRRRAAQGRRAGTISDLPKSARAL